MVKESWLDSIKKAFENLNGEAKYSELYPEVEKVRLKQNLPLTKEWKASVRRTIEDHSSDSDNFRAEDVFKKLGHGYWGLRNRLKENTPYNDEELYVDGLLRERLISVRLRNAKLILDRKVRDSFTCQACGFHYNDKVVECHHLNPLSEKDTLYSSINELITLCPTCHSLAHQLLSKSDDFRNADCLLRGLREIINKCKNI